MPPPERILLLQPRWMGDVLLCTPAIREARRAFPHARIDFATEPAGGEILARNPHLDNILVDEQTTRSRLHLLRRVATTGYDTVVDFRSTASTAQLTLASRARTRIGIRGRGPRNLAYTQLLPRLEIPTYAARHKLDMLGSLGVRVHAVTDLSLDLPIGTVARERAARIWASESLRGDAVVAMSPVSRESFKQWEPARWAAVGDAIAERGARVLITHAPGEAEGAEAVIRMMRHAPIHGYGPTSIEEAAAILELCDLWVGNDGGSKHLAVAVGTPTLMVSRARIGPVWTDATARVRHVYIDAPPPPGCDSRCDWCVETGCLAALGIDEVVQAVQFALDSERR